MNRQIKFRAKTIHGKWAYGYLTQRERGLCIDRNYVNDERNKQDPDCNVYTCPYIVPETVGQFTGLFDFNGQEIYEGDVIETFNSEGRSIRHVVRYGITNYAAFVQSYKSLFDKQEYSGGILNQAYIKEFSKRVIGNIHDNPDLL